MKLAVILEAGDRTVVDRTFLRVQDEGGHEKLAIGFRPGDISALEALCWNLNLAGAVLARAKVPPAVNLEQFEAEVLRSLFGPEPGDPREQLLRTSLRLVEELRSARAGFRR